MPMLALTSPRPCTSSASTSGPSRHARSSCPQRTAPSSGRRRTTYRARRDRARAAGHGRAAAAVVGASGPRRTGSRRSAAAVPAAVADAGVDPGDDRRDRHRLHRLDPASRSTRDGTPLCRARTASSTARTPTRSSGSTTRRSRRPSASRRWRPSAASRGSRATAAASPPSGSSRRRFRCSRRIARSTRRPSRWIEAADWIVWQLCGVETRNVCTAGYKGSLPGRPYPLEAYLHALDPDFVDFVHGKLDWPLSPLGGARRRPHARRRRAASACRPGIAVSVGNVDAHVTAPAARVDRARAHARGDGHLDVPRHERRACSPRCPGCAASSRAASRPACSATRPARAASATSSPGSSSSSCRPPTSTRPRGAGSTRTSTSRSSRRPQAPGDARARRARLARAATARSSSTTS